MRREPRSWLFVPADSDRKIAKALASAADAIIFDLEDSVAPTSKAQAREILRELGGRGDGPQRWVRINPLGNDVQTGFVEQGLYSVAFHLNFSENGHFYVHYASLPSNGDGMIVRFTVDRASPDVVTAERANQTAKVIMRIEQPYYNHNGGMIAFGPEG